MALKKTTLLFEESVYNKLKERAKRENSSIGELVREAVADFYGMKSKEDRLEALKKLKSLNIPVSGQEQIEKEILKGALNDKKV